MHNSQCIIKNKEQIQNSKNRKKRKYRRTAVRLSYNNSTINNSSLLTIHFSPFT